MDAARVSARIEHKQDAWSQVAQAAELLSDAVFEHEDVVELEGWVVVAVGIERDDWQADFFSENLNAFVLIFLFVRWCRLGLLGVGVGGSDC